MKFSCITVEGGLLPVDILEKIAAGDLLGQSAVDFGLDHNRNLLDEMASAFSDARAFWEAYQRALKRLDPAESTTTVTREQWILPLLRALDYHITFIPKAAEVEGRSYAISHRAGTDENTPPIHLEGKHIELDKRAPSGRPRLSPHSLVQEYLNRTEHVWGIVSNGNVLRLLRDSTLIARPAYIEFDLEQMMSGQLFAEFAVFYRLVHRTRLPKSMDDAGECLLEKYYQQALETGGRVREHLRDGVEEALKIFGNGFLSFPANQQLRDEINSGHVTALDFYRQLLRLVYRFLFLMVSEERNLVGPTDPEKRHIYFNYYSISRLRTLAEKYLTSAVHHNDLWQSLLITFNMYSDEQFGKKLTIAPLNGDLFGPHAIPNLESSSLFNSYLVLAIRYLSLYVEDSTYRRINYSALDVEELGSVYESLLDYQPHISIGVNGGLQFDLIPGTERKSTGSYYTRPELVNELIKSALIPVMEQKTAQLKSPEEKIQALLSMKVCDPAAGSGHFLLAATRRIGMEVAKLRSGEDHPTPSAYKEAVRDVIQRCIYGVDVNPLAVDLCKLALWLEGHTQGKPLSFLDHRIRCGNSLIGATSHEIIRKGIPDEAFEPVTGDEKKVASWFKKRNKEEWKGQAGLIFHTVAAEPTAEYSCNFKGFDEVHIDTPTDYHKMEERYGELRHNRQWLRDWHAANIWTYAFFAPLTNVDDRTVPTH